MKSVRLSGARMAGRGQRPPHPARTQMSLTADSGVTDSPCRAHVWCAGCGLAFEFGGDRRWHTLVGAIEPTAVLHCAPTAAVVVEQYDARGIRVGYGPRVDQGFGPSAGAQHLVDG